MNGKRVRGLGQAAAWGISPRLKGGGASHRLRSSGARGQAATELAIFGAILIFIMGAIVRSSVANSYQQNQSLKAMRLAMLKSLQASNAEVSSHNSATILYIEDRLAPDFNKFGALERNPYVNSGSGTFSHRLFYPLDEGEVQSNLPIMDVYINGSHFPLTTAALKWKALTQPPASCTPTAVDYKECLRNKNEWVEQCVFIDCSAGAAGPADWRSRPP